MFIAAPPAAAVVEAVALPEPEAEDVREAEAELDIDELATARVEALRVPHTWFCMHTA